MLAPLHAKALGALLVAAGALSPVAWPSVAYADERRTSSPAEAELA